jgi:hypothetical protein
MYPMLVDGKVMVPKRAKAADGTIGDAGWEEIQPDDPEYSKWLAAIERLGKHIPGVPPGGTN